MRGIGQEGDAPRTGVQGLREPICRRGCDGHWCRRPGGHRDRRGNFLPNPKQLSADRPFIRRQFPRSSVGAYAVGICSWSVRRARIARATKRAAPAAIAQAPRIEYQLSALKNETIDSKAKAIPAIPWPNAPGADARLLFPVVMPVSLPRARILRPARPSEDTRTPPGIQASDERSVDRDT